MNVFLAGLNERQKNILLTQIKVGPESYVPKLSVRVSDIDNKKLYTHKKQNFYIVKTIPKQGAYGIVYVVDGNNHQNAKNDLIKHMKNKDFKDSVLLVYIMYTDKNNIKDENNA